MTARPTPVTADEMATLAHRNPGARIELGDHDATLTVRGKTYVAEYDIASAVV